MDEAGRIGKAVEYSAPAALVLGTQAKVSATTGMTRVDPSSASVGELLATYRTILGELRRRGVLRTDNAPTGDYAEYLICAQVKGELAPNSERSWDVRSPGGTLIQVKARVVSDNGVGARGTRQLSVVRTWGFDSLAVVLFGLNYEVHRAALIPMAVARDAARYIKHVNGFRLMATDELLAHPESQDITEQLRATAAQI